ncbi:hypothetical protein Nos7524_0300 [Nostoc sp. PCC 7524]|uniref:hypothetical protein n=1 Tax=Nostoc sp. (strain ATCC 29411 / PCC 7524) TaxID=28072 RepID=UPI00029F3476|nr:hypothetical protein [Nostoc sp. PCC 7524]AFY46221.1 hypothetical protein Nos7524_0300 [Nostoc sp. PCC 7524]
MQPDLIGLEISKGELRRLTEVSPDTVLRSATIATPENRLKFWQNEILVSLLITSVIVGLGYGLIILPTIGTAMPLGIILFIIVLIVVLLGRSLWPRAKSPKSLKKLLEAVDQYQGLIVAVDVNDQLAVSGELDDSLHNRDKVITALQLLREDLVHAFKTERLLRDNKKLLAENQDLSVKSLNNIPALQANSQASEYTLLLNQALQIALDVQAQLRNLQSSR